MRELEDVERSLDVLHRLSWRKWPQVLKRAAHRLGADRSRRRALTPVLLGELMAEVAPQVGQLPGAVGMARLIKWGWNREVPPETLRTQLYRLS
jgi:hypothetical protein